MLLPSPALLPEGVEAAAGSLSYSASEDTYVKSSTPAVNYGTAAELIVETDASTKQSLVRFVVSALPADATGIPQRCGCTFLRMARR